MASKFGGVEVQESGSKFGGIPVDKLPPGVPNPISGVLPGGEVSLNAHPIAPEGLHTIPVAPWGFPSTQPHKSFADTFGHDTTVGKAADFISGASNFLPSNDAMIGASAPAVATGGGASGLIKRAITLGGGMATQWGVEKGLRMMGVSEPLVRVLSDAAGFGVASRGGHGKAAERPIETTDLGTTAPTARGPIKPVAPMNVSPYSATGGTLDVPPPPAASAAPAGTATPSLDEIVVGLTEGAYKKFANAPVKYQQAAVNAQNNLSGVPPTPKPVSPAAAPPAVAPPPGMPAEPPAPSVIPRYASTELQPNSQFPPVEHMPSRYRAPNGEVSVSERIAHKKDVQIAEYLLSPESGVKIASPEDWNKLPLSEKNRIAGEAYVKYGGNPKFVQKGTTNFGANYRPGQQRSISGRSADVGIDHVYQTLKELMVPPPPQ